MANVLLGVVGGADGNWENPRLSVDPPMGRVASGTWRVRWQGGRRMRTEVR